MNDDAMGRDNAEPRSDDEVVASVDGRQLEREALDSARDAGSVNVTTSGDVYLDATDTSTGAQTPGNKAHEHK